MIMIKTDNFLWSILNGFGFGIGFALSIMFLKHFFHITIF